jgi:uncharacterized protein (TIGR02145 family)
MKKLLLFSFLLVCCTIVDVQAQLFGGQLKSTVSAYAPGTVHCNPQNRTAVVEVTNPVTTRTWMDRNLGATRVATSTTDAEAFGDLYQWGRRADGHQCRNSPTTSTRSSVDQPTVGLFIRVNSTTNDWREPQNDALWQGVAGINNPCPQGFRIPTEDEVRDERRTWTNQSNVGAFNSVLKLPMAGWRDEAGVVSLTAQGSSYGFIWTSTDSGTVPTTADPNIQYKSDALAYFSGNAFENPYFRARGYSVRCIKKLATE